MSLLQKLNERKFPITYEHGSPIGPDIDVQLLSLMKILNNLESSNVLAISFFNNPSGKPYMDSLQYASSINRLLLESGSNIETIANIRIRDWTVLFMNSHLWGAWNNGVKNLLMITGDHYKNSPDLMSCLDGIYTITHYLNEGYCIPELDSKIEWRDNRYIKKEIFHKCERLKTRKSNGNTGFCVGAALSPTRRDEIKYIQRKLEAGVNFFQTQLTYDAQDIRLFLENARQADLKMPVPILVGTGPIKSIRTLDFIHGLPGVRIPENIQSRLRDSTDMTQESINICVEMYGEIKDMAKEYDVHLGAHVMSIHQPPLASNIISQVAKI